MDSKGAVGAYKPRDDPYDPTSFESPTVNAAAPPLVAALAILFTISPFGFLLEGFHVWIHEVARTMAAAT